MQTAQFTKTGSYTCQNAPRVTPKTLAPAYQNLTLVTKPRTDLCESNDTKLTIPSTDFQLEGSTVMPLKLGPNYEIKDFCLAFSKF